MNTVSSTEEYLARLPADLAGSPLAAVALRLAEGLDESRNSLNAKSFAAKALQDIMRELRELAPPVEVRDELDDIRERRRIRLAGSSTTAD